MHSITGSVAASFAVEQIGLPKLTVQDEVKKWYGAAFGARNGAYRERLGWRELAGAK